jgi:type II secretory pathway pseudopilin PulG
MAIIAILAAALGIVLAKLRTRAMVQRARSDIQAMSNALEMYMKDIGTYPTAPWTNTYTPVTGFADMVLYTALTDKDAGAVRDADGNPTSNANRGWGDATDGWDFISDASRTSKHFLDPWGTPYYYLSHGDYLRGVAIRDPTEDPGSASGKDWPRVYGTTPAIDDYRTVSNERLPKAEYFGPAPDPSVFFNPYTFQLHSKGPDQKTDQDDNPSDLTHIDPCDRGTDKDDINNWSRGASEN